jgi:hypothetical protein
MATPAHHLESPAAEGVRGMCDLDQVRFLMKLVGSLSCTPDRSARRPGTPASSAPPRGTFSATERVRVQNPAVPAPAPVPCLRRCRASRFGPAQELRWFPALPLQRRHRSRRLLPGLPPRQRHRHDLLAPSPRRCQHPVAVALGVLTLLTDRLEGWAPIPALAVAFVATGITALGVLALSLSRTGDPQGLPVGAGGVAPSPELLTAQ